MAAPILAGMVLVGATVGWYVTVQGTAGTGKGGLARLRFDAACVAEARPVLMSRLTDLGLEPQAEDGLTFVVRTPGLADDLEHLPKALARPGTLEVAVHGEPKPVVIDNVGVQLAFSGTPVTLVLLKDAVSEEGLTVKVDGQPVELESASGLELLIAARGQSSTDALRLATDRAVALRHPLPCAITPAGAERIGP